MYQVVYMWSPFNNTATQCLCYGILVYRHVTMTMISQAHPTMLLASVQLYSDLYSDLTRQVNII